MTKQWTIVTISIIIYIINFILYISQLFYNEDFPRFIVKRAPVALTK